MNFIDKLEALLLRPRAKVYHGLYQGGVFRLGCYRGNYGRQDKEIKKAGIASMMAALRDNNYKDPLYEAYSLDLITFDYFNDILALEPSYEDLFNLYRVTGYITGKKLEHFLLIVDDKEWKIKFFKHGCSYRDSSKRLRTIVGYLGDMSDDEWIEAFTAYIKNSNDAIENEGKHELSEIFINCIKDNKKCEQFICDTLGMSVQFDNLFTDSEVTQLTLESKTSIKHFDCYSDSELNNYLKYFSKLLIEQDLANVDKIDYYTSDLTYNFVFYNDKDGRVRELTKRLLVDTLPLFKSMEKLSNRTIIEHFKDDFTKLVSHHILDMSMPEKNQDIKIHKI